MEVTAMTIESQINLIPKQKRQPRGIQPKIQASKNRTVVAARRKKIIVALLAGKTAQQAGVEAGFSRRTAGVQVSQTLKQPEVQASFLKALEKAGLSDDCLAQHHIEMLNGKKYLPVRGNPDDYSQADPDAIPGYLVMPDLQAKAKALDLVYKLTGSYTERHELAVKRPVVVVIRKFCAHEAENSLINV